MQTKTLDPPVSVRAAGEVKLMIHEECAAFSKDKNDVGCIPLMEVHGSQYWTRARHITRVSLRKTVDQLQPL